MDSLVKLNVLGITFSQVQAGAYALILAEEGGQRRIPIIIGTPEAQSIAIFLEGLRPPRPLTHDMFISFMQAFNITLEEIYIYKFEEGVFYSEIIFSGETKIKIDARTSDAIALAIRCNAPIITTESIMQEAGVILEEEIEEVEEKNMMTSSETSHNLDFESLTLDELKHSLEQAVGDEDYEKASKIRDEMNKRTGNNPS